MDGRIIYKVRKGKRAALVRCGSPRGKSGKIVELAVRDVVHGRPVKNKEALANPEALTLYEGIKELQS